MLYFVKKEMGWAAMRADRLLSIILSLQIRGRASAKTFAEKLEVSERTIYRDIEALSFSGFPIYAVRGSQGGFVLDENFHTDITGMTFLEIKELIIRRLPGPLTDLGMGSKFDQIINKLIMSLPSTHRQKAYQFSRRIYLDPVRIADQTHIH